MCKLIVTTALILSIVAGQASVSGSAVPARGHDEHLSPPSAAPRVSNLNQLAPGSHTITITVGALSRTFILEVPPNTLAANRSLVLVYHGAEDTAVATIQKTNLLQQVTARGDLIAFLQGYQDTWNEGSGSTPASLAHVNDVAFTAAVISRIGQLESFDRARVAAVGFSNGAIMVEDLGCRLSSVISMIVPVEGQLSTVQSASCSLARPVSVYEIHGTTDPTIPYNGGYFATAIGEDTVLSAPASVGRWSRLDRCTVGPVSFAPSSTISLSSYSKCRGGATVTLRTIIGGQHEWPYDIGQLVVQALARLPR